MNDFSKRGLYFAGGVFGLLGLPIATATLACAGAEAFTGAKDPLFESGVGLVVGAVVALICAIAMMLAPASGGSARPIVRGLLVVDAAAVLTAILLIRVAYLFQ